MATQAREALFSEKLQEFEGLIRFASTRYRIDGVLSPDDLYQEGLMILDKMVRGDYRHDLDPHSTDFRKLFKVELWHGLNKVLQKYKTQKRNYKCLINGDISQIEIQLQSASRSKRRYRAHTTEIVASEAGTMYVRAEQHDLLEFLEAVRDAEKFVDALAFRISDDDRLLLFELLYPRSWEDIPNHLRVTITGDDYWRTPRKVPFHVIADVLEWSLTKARRSLARIRREASLLAKEYGFELISSVDERKRRKRRKRRRSNVEACA